MLNPLHILFILGLSLIACKHSQTIEVNQRTNIPEISDPFPQEDSDQDSKIPGSETVDSPYPYSRTAFVHLFEWKWTDIAEECKNVLGPSGYAAVQVSPPTEHAIINPGQVKNSYPWFQRYQPVSYRLNSRSGDEQEFTEMVKTCKEYGVDIYVDAVINHMAAVTKIDEIQIGSDGSSFGYYSYPDFVAEEFHQCGAKDNAISSYMNRFEVQNCELLTLADLKTEDEKVQEKIVSYLSHLMTIGVAGFRIDAAKHMPAEDIRSIINSVEKKVGKRPYIYQEVIEQADEPIKAEEYFQDNMNVTEFMFSKELSRVFKTGNLAWLNDTDTFGEGWQMLPSNKVVVFTDNHDNQRDHGGGGDILNFKEGNLYKQANIFMLSWPYGYPKVMSSFAFDNKEQGPPSKVGGITKSIYGNNESSCGKEWICEHRWPEIRAMVDFRNFTNGEPISNWYSNKLNLIAFSRGDKGFVILNQEENEQAINLKTGLPAGTYCNILDASCEQAYLVDDQGMLNSTIKAKSSIVLINR